MNNLRKENLELVQKLLAILNDDDNDLSVDSISYINDDLDHIDVLYFQKDLDGDYQVEIWDELQRGELSLLTDQEANDLLTSRLENSI